MVTDQLDMIFCWISKLFICDEYSAGHKYANILTNLHLIGIMHNDPDLPEKA